MVKIITIVSCLFCSTLFAQKEQVTIAAGNELYKKQDYEKAAEQYEKAKQINKNNSIVNYNLGNALYKKGKNEEAEKAYDDAAENTKSAPEKSKAFYNKGVALTRQKKLPESIDAYKQSLRLNSNDQQVRENLQMALNELKKQQQQQPKQEPKKDDNKSKQDNQPKPQQENNNSKLNQQQVEQMLNSLRQEEKRLQQSVQKKNSQASTNAKDW